MSETLKFGDLELKSRLIVGTGKYKSLDETRAALEASGADMVTVAVRRLDLSSSQGDPIASYLKTAGYKFLPNTAGCYTAEDAVRTCRLARELGMSGVVKVEVIGDPKTLFPDVAQTLEACRTLIAEGFTVLPYTSDDPVVAKRLQDMGCAAVMPLAAPIGSGLGIRNPYAIEILREAITIPLIVDAGVGTASDAAIAMELGCDGILMNTAIAGAREPVRMARAMKLAVEAGREAFLAGRIARKLHASASSPLEGVIGSRQLG